MQFTMGETQQNNSNSTKAPAPLTPQAPTQEVRRDVPPPIAPVNGPVEPENTMNIPVNINLDPKSGGVVKANGLMPEAISTQKILDARPKVSIWLPLTGGEKLGIAQEFVSINGYPYWIKKGMMVMVPQPVAELLMNLYNIEVGDSAFGRSMRIDRNTSMQKALN